MKRRSFIIGLSALFVAPAIVRADSLMPIQVLDRIDPRFVGPVDLEFITNEFSRLMTTFGVKSQLDCDVVRTRMRTNVQFLSPSADMSLSRKDFSERILRGAAAEAANNIPKGMRVIARPKQLILKPEVERSVTGVAYAEAGPGVRAVTDYQIAYDRVLTQFDMVLVK